MQVAPVGLLLALSFTCGCVRLGYDAVSAPHGSRDASPQDGGEGDGTTDAGASGAAKGGKGATDVDMRLGDTGLKVADILGFYNDTWGDMVLRKVDNEIWGAYAYRGGTIVGNITSDGVFEGWWSQTPSRDASDMNAGEVEFRWMKMDRGAVIHLDGRWRYGAGGTWNDYWDVDLVTGRTAPASITDHFDVPEDFKPHP